MALFDCALFLVVAASYCAVHFFQKRVFGFTGLVFILACLAVNDWVRILYHGPRRWLVASIVLVLSARVAYLFNRYTKKTLRLQRYTLPWMIAMAAILAIIPIGRHVVEARAEARLPKPAAGLRNVVVIVVDTLRADHLSLYGYDRNTSPNLARIAEQGVTFENAMASSSWTLPSHASMLTGRYPHDHGAEYKSSVLDGRLPVIGEDFQKLGYRTGAFSANNYYFTRRQGFGEGFIHFDDYIGSLHDAFDKTRYFVRLGEFAYDQNWTRRPLGTHTAEDVNRRTLQWIDGGSRPFFVFLNYMDVHSPYIPVAPYRGSFSQRWHTDGQTGVKATHDYAQQRLDAYDECIQYVDVQIQRLFEELRKRGRDKDTVVVITSDHGEAFNEHGLWGHNNALYRELIHVPLIIWAPGYVPSGLRVARPVSTTALAPTLLSLVGATSRATFATPSLSLFWTSPQQVEDWPDTLSELAYFQGRDHTLTTSRGAQVSLTTAEWHLIIGPDGPMLYRCCENLSERENLANTAKGHELVPKLTHEIAVMRTGAEKADDSRKIAVSRFE
jgi:arylsulfatase A-like enzyme